MPKNTVPRRVSAPKKPKTEPAKQSQPFTEPNTPERAAASHDSDELISGSKDRPVLGALIDPTGHKPEVLTEAEYNALRDHLLIRRSDNEADEVLADFINSATFLYGKEASAEGALGWLAGMWMGDHHDSSDGLLIPRIGRTFAVLENEGEHDILQSVLAVLRAGGWFAEWLELQCGAIAKASTPADRYPSPLTIVSTLTEAIVAFEEQTERARAMVKLRPDLFLESKEAAHA